MKEHLPSLSAAGNAAALVVVVLVAAVLSRPSDVAQAGGAAGVVPPGLTGAPGPRARAVVLVVIDGLRVDVARDRAVMPFTCDLALRGGSTTAQVEALIPSTIAGVTTLGTGAVPGPASFLRDFGSPPAERGGLFEALAGRGERSFVTGPALWSDLFGRWTDAPHAAAALGGSDEAILQAGLLALNDPAYRLGVFHFGATDEAAHLYGGRSAEYARAAGWCDDAVRQIAARLGPDAAIVVTSDHGVTDGGGHAGPEPEVLATPVVYFGPGFPPGRLPPLRQRDVPAIIAAALGLERPPLPLAATGNAVPRRAGFAVLAIVALLCGVRLWSALAAGAGARPHAFWLNLTVWVALALLLLDQPAAASLLAVIALVVRGARLARGSPRYVIAPALALAIGAAWALLRIAAEWRYGAAPFEIPVAGMPLAVVFGLAVSVPIGLMLRHERVSPAVAKPNDPTPARRAARPALWAGVALAVGVAPAYVLSGQTLSLSSVGVTEAYHVALHGGGIPAAVVVVVLLQALPALALVVGCVLAQNRRLIEAAAGAFFVGISAVPTGEAAAAAAVLLVSEDVRLNSLSLGCLLRAAAAMVFLTCGAALVILARPRLRDEATAGEQAPAVT